MSVEIRKWADVVQGDWVLMDGQILQVREIDPTDWEESRTYLCSDGFAHERNINGWTAISDRLPEGYEPSTR